MGKRNRTTARKNGAQMETVVQDYLQWALNDRRILRMRTHGSKDVGDIGNVFFHGEPVTIEVKWTQTMDATKHMREAIREAGNADSPYPWVVQKKNGTGLDSLHKLGQQYAYTTDLVLADMLAQSPEMLASRIQGMPLGRKKQLRLITLHEFALILNSGLPLGPEDDDGR